MAQAISTCSHHSVCKAKLASSTHSNGALALLLHLVADFRTSSELQRTCHRVDQLFLLFNNKLYIILAITGNIPKNKKLPWVAIHRPLVHANSSDCR